ncbi:MAG: glutaredoxin domain-containing protein [Thermodesulfobacteriota bacterium]
MADTPFQEKDTASPVIIYGKDSCPFTRRARDAFTAQGRDVLFYNLPDHPEKMAEFLSHSPEGKIPLVIDKDIVCIGFEGT